MHNIFILGGCNGSGKSTISRTLLPDILDCKEFINADEIARGLSPFQPEKVAFKAGRLMLERIKTLAESKVNFAFETTLSTKSFIPLLKSFKENGSILTLIFLYLTEPQLAVQRIEERTRRGGHHIPPEVVMRRYYRGLKNFKTFFLPIANSWLVFDNSGDAPILVARGGLQLDTQIYIPDIWDRLNVKTNE